MANLVVEFSFRFIIYSCTTLSFGRFVLPCERNRRKRAREKKTQTKTETKLDRLNEQTKKENKILSIYALPLINLSFFLSTSAMLYKYNSYF